MFAMEISAFKKYFAGFGTAHWTPCGAAWSLGSAGPLLSLPWRTTPCFRSRASFLAEFSGGGSWLAAFGLLVAA